MPKVKVGILGATSVPGDYLLSQLEQANYNLVAFTRKQPPEETKNQVEWKQLPRPDAIQSTTMDYSDIPYWICAAPIAILPAYFKLMKRCGVRRVVALSSTSRFTKTQSRAPEEQALVKRFENAEDQIKKWAEVSGVEWVVLRPTLIYGRRRDKNVMEIARFISHFRFFPIFGKATGLRQPIHASDVAAACVAALQAPGAANKAFNISGAETLTYRDMVVSIFSALEKTPRFFSIPLWAFSIAVAALRFLPRYRNWSSAMAERMNVDMVFDHTEATSAFGFSPRKFILQDEDLP